jgi:geranylgeranyl diphosphate synthase type I
MRSSERLPQDFQSYQQRIERELKEIIGSNPLTFYGILRYHMGWQDKQGCPYHGETGKFVRPLLCLLSCQAAGGDAVWIMPAAAALELIHNFSLIHDDIQDASCERHHRPTVWKIWGQSQAINAGDDMFALAFAAVFKLKYNGIKEQRVMAAAQLLNEACLKLCEGQYLDIAYQSRLDVTIKDYLDMIAKKTAALMAASTAIGTCLAVDNDKMVDSLYEFGEELGMAYQIQDDVLGIWGKEEEIGKPVKDDISQGKKTLPVVYAFENCKDSDRKKLEELYSQEVISGEAVLMVMEILDRSGACRYGQELIQQYHRQALTKLEASGLDLSRQTPLKEVASFLLERDY